MLLDFDAAVQVAPLPPVGRAVSKMMDDGLVFAPNVYPVGGAQL